MKNLKKTLNEKYWKKEMSTLEVAKDMGMSKGWVLKKMKLLNIKRRSLRQAGILRAKKEGLSLKENI